MIINPFIYGASGPAPRPTVTWDSGNKGASVTLSAGNLTATKTGAAAYASVLATSGIPDAETGYAELVVAVTGGSPTDIIVGVALNGANVNDFLGNDSSGWSYYARTGQSIHSGVGTSYGSSYSPVVTVGVAFKAGKVWFALNNTWQNTGDPVTGTNPAYTGIAGTIFLACSVINPTDAVQLKAKLADFTYTPPTGFTPWGT